MLQPTQQTGPSLACASALLRAGRRLTLSKAGEVAELLRVIENLSARVVTVEEADRLLSQER